MKAIDIEGAKSRGISYDANENPIWKLRGENRRNRPRPNVRRTDSRESPSGRKIVGERIGKRSRVRARLKPRLHFVLPAE